MSTSTSRETPDIEPPPPAQVTTGWADVTDVEAPDRRVWVAVAIAAVMTDLALRSGVRGVAGAALVLVVAGGCVATGRVPNRRAWPLFAAAAALGLGLVTRTSPWLLPFDVLAACGLLVLGVTLSRQGDPLDLTIPGMVGRGLHALVHGVIAPGFLLARPPAATTTTSRGRTSVAVGRGVLLAAPVVFVIAVLLRSADPVFASFIPLPDDVGDLVAHAVLLTIGAWGAAGLLRVASAAPFVTPAVSRRPLGTVEATTVLGALVVLFAAFAAAQIAAVVGGADYVRRTAGLSYADYARNGFFQLLAAATITLAVLLALRATTEHRDAQQQRRFTVLSEIAVALTFVLVAGAVRRLALYEQAYGLTMLRLYSLLFALWMGAVFALLGVALARSRGDHERKWLVPSALALAVAGLAALNAANPEAIVVRRNVDRFAATNPERLDVDYLASLSDDAVPELVRSLPRIDQASAEGLLERLCNRPRPIGGTTFEGPWSFNFGADAATEARNQACPTSL